MKSKQKSMSSVITLGKKASEALGKVLREPSTAQQKKFYAESRGTYSSHEKKWRGMK